MASRLHAAYSLRMRFIRRARRRWRAAASYRASVRADSCIASSTRRALRWLTSWARTVLFTQARVACASCPGCWMGSSSRGFQHAWAPSSTGLFITT
eukprot:5166053-Prymnesium_polylepis.1